MTDLEQQLRRALARKEPPEFLEAKILNAAARQSESARDPWYRRFFFASPTSRRLSLVTALAAAVFVVGGITWQQEHARKERMEGEAAKARLELALKITGTKLQKIQELVLSAQAENGQNEN